MISPKIAASYRKQKLQTLLSGVGVCFGCKEMLVDVGRCGSMLVDVRVGKVSGGHHRRELSMDFSVIFLCTDVPSAKLWALSTSGLSGLGCSPTFPSHAGILALWQSARCNLPTANWGLSDLMRSSQISWSKLNQ